MTKSEIFKAAHNTAKNTVKLIGKYITAFSIALKDVYKSLRKPSIKTVLVHWSECGIFKDETTYTFDEYTKLANQAAIINGNEGGYLKTKITINYSNGDEYGMRHDIGCDQANLNERMKEYAEYCLAPDAPEFMKPSAELKKFYLLIA